MSKARDRRQKFGELRPAPHLHAPWLFRRPSPITGLGARKPRAEELALPMSAEKRRSRPQHKVIAPLAESVEAHSRVWVSLPIARPTQTGQIERSNLRVIWGMPAQRSCVMDTKRISAVSGTVLFALTATASAGPMSFTSSKHIAPPQTQTEPVYYRYYGGYGLTGVAANAQYYYPGSAIAHGIIGQAPYAYLPQVYYQAPPIVVRPFGYSPLQPFGYSPLQPFGYSPGAPWEFRRADGREVRRAARAPERRCIAARLLNPCGNGLEIWFGNRRELLKA
jgi:hypothetical protein